MLGAIVGDIVGSVYEFDNHRSKDFVEGTLGGMASQIAVRSNPNPYRS